MTRPVEPVAPESVPAAPGGSPARSPLLVAVNAALAFWGLLAFVSGFLDRYRSSGEFASASISGFGLASPALYPAVVLGALGLVGAVSRRGPRQVYLLCLAGTTFALAVGELFTFGSDFGGETRGPAYWLLFVVVVLQLLTATVGTLVQTGVVAVQRRRAPAQAPYGSAPYGSPPYPPAPYPPASYSSASYPPGPSPYPPPAWPYPAAYPSVPNPALPPATGAHPGGYQGPPPPPPGGAWERPAG